MLSWALCVSTLNRPDVLRLCVAHALAQTRPPAEVIVVDASESWSDHARIIAALFEAHPAIPLRYEAARARSLTVQRNHAIGLATADILFLIDDDALMYPDCASVIMDIYERDAASEIAAVGATPAPTPPTRLETSEGRRAAGLSRTAGVGTLLRRSALFRFLWRTILMMPLESRFIRYDPPRHAAARQRFDPARFPGTSLREVLEGFTMTVRRRVAVLEPFEDALIGYAAAEDLDATYRFSRHGFVVQAAQARLYHHVAATGRLDRKALRAFEVMNVAFFVRRNSARPHRAYIKVIIFALRSLVATALKDLAARRFSMPEARGVLRAMVFSVPMFFARHQDLKAWYQQQQQRVLYG